eukprot:755587-Hanusia_phi.AAC.5
MLRNPQASRPVPASTLLEGREPLKAPAARRRGKSAMKTSDRTPAGSRVSQQGHVSAGATLSSPRLTSHSSCGSCSPSPRFSYQMQCQHGLGMSAGITRSRLAGDLLDSLSDKLKVSSDS